MSGELERRFKTLAFELMREIENLLLKSCNGVKVQTLFLLSVTFTMLYNDHLDITMLQVQLVMLPDLIETLKKQQNLGIKSINSVSTMVYLKNMNMLSKTFLSQID